MALKDAIRDFYNLLNAPLTVSNRYAQVARAEPCANYAQLNGALITCNMSCVTWYEETAALSNVTELKSHLKKKIFF